MTQRQTTLAMILTLVAGPAALQAQAPPDEEPAVAGAETPDGQPAAEAEPPADDGWSEPPPPRQPPPPPPPPEPVVVAEPPAEGGVDWLPSERIGGSFGLGFGWSFPGPDMWTPNTIGARFRLDGGLAIEPNLTIRASGSGDNDDFTDDPRALQIGVGTMLRVPVASAGPVDFLILGTAGVTTTIDLEPGDTRSLSASIGYGLGLELWLATRFSIGMDATNALFNLSWTASDNPITGDTAKAINWSVGVVWNPQLRVLATLYF